MILGLVHEAVSSGASAERVSLEIGIDLTTLQRWRHQGIGEDRRAGPNSEPANKLSAKERALIIDVACSPEFRDLSPKQIVPRLADRAEYIASESTMHRILREEKMMAHRGRAKAPQNRHRPPAKTATAPCQLWSWDITYVRGPVRGTFFYLYIIMDVWSRKIVGWRVHSEECAEYAAALIGAACAAESVDQGQLILHSDNGTPMKGATMLATLQQLGVVPSFSRPSVSDDNPYSESLFRTLKYRPEYPSQPFESLAAVSDWVTAFVGWYNLEHLHSGIGFVTPSDRHAGRHRDVLRERSLVYEAARQRNPRRWSGAVRSFDPVETVILNPEHEAEALEVAA